MSNGDLHRLLGELHNDLTSVKSVDPQTEVELQQLASDIQRVLDASPSPDSAAPYRGLRRRLADSVLKFESSYPQLSRTLENVVDTLAFYNL
jgi:hypothetical protein